MDTYVFANQKGGVGKTTVTLSVAAELAARGVRVLLIDLDVQASATKVAGIDVEAQTSMADVMLQPDHHALRDAIATTDWGFALAPSETALASRESRRSTADEFVLRRQLETCRRYDIVLVDCPPSLGVLTLNALAAASHLVVVTEPSFLALHGIEELLETRDLVCAHYIPDLVLAGVVINRVERTVEHRAGLAEIASSSGPTSSGRRRWSSGRRCRMRCVAGGLCGTFAVVPHRSCAPISGRLRIESADGGALRRDLRRAAPGCPA